MHCFRDKSYRRSRNLGHWTDDGIISTDPEREVAPPFEWCGGVRLVRR